MYIYIYHIYIINKYYISNNKISRNHLIALFQLPKLLPTSSRHTITIKTAVLTTTRVSLRTMAAEGLLQMP